MSNPDVETRYTSAAELRALLGEPMDLAVRKALSRLDRYCREFIARSPLVCLGSVDGEGRSDVSPRGDRPGFVQVLDDHTLYIPERPGNSRYDTLFNLLQNPTVGLLFFVPGFEDMLRVNGTAEVIHNEALAARCAVNGKQPKVGVRITVQEAFLHCAKALKRSRVWDPSTQFDRGELPSLGRMILEQAAAPGADHDEAVAIEVDAAIEENYRTTLY